MNRFPLEPGAKYSYARGFTSTHHGVDIFAKRGTPVVAVVGGTARAREEPKGGKVVYLEGADGTTYFYGHLDAWAPILAMQARSGSGFAAVRVPEGTRLGRVGNTGNAAGKPPHLHFQMRRGSLRIDPFGPLRNVDGRAKAVVAAIAIVALLWLSRRTSRGAA